jgi:hypothetical protein
MDRSLNPPLTRLDLLVAERERNDPVQLPRTGMAGHRAAVAVARLRRDIPPRAQPIVVPGPTEPLKVAVRVVREN